MWRRAPPPEWEGTVPSTQERASFEELQTIETVSCNDQSLRSMLVASVHVSGAPEADIQRIVGKKQSQDTGAARPRFTAPSHASMTHPTSALTGNSVTYRRRNRRTAPFG